jgi:branched-chain amino acid transport system substrate-binding protein
MRTFTIVGLFLARSRTRQQLTLSALALLCTACTPEPKPVWRVGLLGTLEGRLGEASGLPAERGARIAVDQINAAGGVVIAGVPHEVVLVSRHTGARADEAAAAMRSLINRDSADVVVGPQFSRLAVTAATVANAADVPMIAPMASSPAVTDGRPLVSRMAFLDAVQGEVLARFVYDSLGVRRAASMHNAASGYGGEIVGLFSATFSELGGRMVAREAHAADDTSAHRAEVDRMLAQQPEVLLLPDLSPRDSVMLRRLREAGFRGRVLGSDSWDAVSMARIPDLSGTIIVANWDRRTERPAARYFMHQWNADPKAGDPRAAAVATYDAVHLLARAAEKAGVRSGRPLADSVQTFGRYEGAMANYTFGGTGNPRRSATILEVRGDTTALRGVIEPRR